LEQKKGLKNQCFESLDALRKGIEERVEQLTAERVISVASYEFIWEALFYAALHIKLVLLITVYRSLFTDINKRLPEPKPHKAF
jgi:hypothetical protein